VSSGRCAGADIAHPAAGSGSDDDREREVTDGDARAEDVETDLWRARWRPRRGRRHKDRIRWCKGRVGREHELTVKVVRDSRWPTYEYRCRDCERVFDRYYTIFVMAKPEWLVAWERDQGRSRPG